MVPSIAKILNDMQDRLNDMDSGSLESLIKAGDNSLLEISNLAELLSHQAQILGDADCTAKPSDTQLSMILFSIAHSLQVAYEMLSLADEARFALTQKNPTQ